MDFQKVEDFVRSHWPAGLMVAIIMAPAVWTIASTHFSERITALETRVKELSERVAVLDEFAKRSREKFASSTSQFTADELSTPSTTVNMIGATK